MAKKSSAATDPSAAPADNLSTLQLKLDDPAPAPEPKTDAPPVDDTPAPAAEVIPQNAGTDEPRVAPGVAATMRQWGYEVDDDATDDDVRGHLEGIETKAGKYDDLEREHAALRQRLAELESQRQQPEPKPAEQPKPAEAVTDDDLGIPSRPEVDEVTRQVLLFAHQAGKVNEGPGGILTTDDGNLRGYVDSYNKQLTAARAYDAEWTPRKVAELIAKKQIADAREAIRKEVTAELQGTLQGRDQQAYFNGFRAENAAWLYTQDGQQFTEVGQQFAAEVDDLLKRGYAPEDAVRRAKAFVQAETGKTPWVAEQPKPTDTPAERVVKFRNRLKNNGADTLPTVPVSRPAAGARAHATNGMTFDQKLSTSFSALMSEKVADRM